MANIFHDIRNAFENVRIGSVQSESQTFFDHSDLKLQDSLKDFEKRFNGRNLWIALLGSIRSDVVFIALIGALLVIVTAILPIILRWLFLALEVGDNSSAIEWGGIVTVLMGLKVCFTAFLAWAEQRSIIKIRQLMNRFLFRRLRDADMEDLHEQQKEPLAFITSYSGQLTQSIYIVDFVISTIMVIVLVAIMLSWYGIPSLLALLAVVLITLILQRLIVVIGHMYHSYLKVDHQRVNLVKLTLENLSSIRRQKLSRQILFVLDSIRQDQRKILYKRASWQIFNRTLEDHFASLTSLCLVGTTLLTNIAVSSSDLFSLLVLLGVIIDVVGNNLVNYRVLRNSLGPTREIEELCRCIKPLEQPKQEPTQDNHVKIFSIGKPEQSLYLPEGSRVAVLGRTGSGKSRLLAKLANEVQSNKSLVKTSLTGHVFGSTVMVNREFPLLDGLFGDVVTLWASPVDEALYDKALYASGWLGELAEDSLGDARPLSGQQKDISEGQQQRLALAQALYQRPDVLLLDDVFASINPNLADIITQRILQFHPNQSVIYTTSRIELARYAEHLLLLDGDHYLFVEVSRLKQADPDIRQKVQNILGENLTCQLLEILKTKGPEANQDEQDLLKRARKLIFSSKHRAPGLMAYDQSTQQHITLNNLWKNTLSIFPPTAVFIIVLAILVTTIAGIASAVLIDEIGEGNFLRISKDLTLTFLGVAAILGIIASIFRYYFSFSIPIQSIDRLHRTMLSYLTRGDIDENHGNRMTGRLTQDFQALEMETPNGLANLAKVILGTIGTIAYIVWGVPLALLLLLPCALLLRHAYYANKSIIVSAARLRASTRGPVFGFLGAALATVSFRRSPAFRSAFEDRFSFLADIQAAGSYWASLSRISIMFWIQILGWLIFVSVLWAILISSVMHLSVNRPSLLVFLTLTFSQQLVSLVQSLQSADVLQTQFERLAQVLGQLNLPRAGISFNFPHDELLTQKYHHIALEAQDVCFDTKLGQNIISDFSMKVTTGEHLALIGPSGSGKSTLANLLVGHLKPKSGLIKQFGKTYSMSQLTNILILESRAPNLNITLHHFLDPQGSLSINQLNDILVTFGVTFSLDANLTDLSLGQQQTANIVRALIAKPVILILDEATSGLDSVDERRVFQALFNYNHSLTVLAILHRPDNLDLMDRIIDLKTQSYKKEKGL